MWDGCIVVPGSKKADFIYFRNDSVAICAAGWHNETTENLLLLIRDDRGLQLGCAFIQDDLQVGHDIYCSTWEQLQNDARYGHPNISKLMDAKIVYCADEKDRERLESLRKTVREILAAPFSEEDYAKAEKLLKEAEHCYTLRRSHLLY